MEIDPKVLAQAYLDAVQGKEIPTCGLAYGDYILQLRPDLADEVKADRLYVVTRQGVEEIGSFLEQFEDGP